MVVIETSYDQRVPGYESWWDVPIAEVSERDSVKAARTRLRGSAQEGALFLLGSVHFGSFHFADFGRRLVGLGYDFRGKEEVRVATPALRFKRQRLRNLT